MMLAARLSTKIAMPLYPASIGTATTMDEPAAMASMLRQGRIRVRNSRPAPNTKARPMSRTV